MNNKKKKLKSKSETTEKIQSYDILKVFWKDHFAGTHTWVSDVKDLRTKPLICVSVGFKVHEDKETLTLAQNMGENLTMADTITIIKNCITKRDEIGSVEYGKKN